MLFKPSLSPHIFPPPPRNHSLCPSMIEISHHTSRQIKILHLEICVPMWNWYSSTTNEEKKKSKGHTVFYHFFLSFKCGIIVGCVAMTDHRLWEMSSKWLFCVKWLEIGNDHLSHRYFSSFVLRALVRIYKKRGITDTESLVRSPAVCVSIICNWNQWITVGS